LNADSTQRSIRIAIDVNDPALADRLAAALDGVAGIECVGTETADVVMIRPADAATVATDSSLTPRELEVLALMAEGFSNKAIASRLGISPHTVTFHVGSLIDKLDAIGRTDAVAQAARLHVINL
jgi:DNA-binding CsgD family transcriptional regulator